MGYVSWLIRQNRRRNLLKSPIKQYIHEGYLITYKTKKELCEKCSEISRYLEKGLMPDKYKKWEV